MAPIESPASRHPAAPAALLVLWTAAATASPFAAPLVGGLLFVLLGVLVLSFWSAAGLGVAPRSARSLWESLARTAWILGVLGGVVLFVRALGASEGGIEELASGMALSFVPAIAGLALAGLAMAIVFRLRPRADSTPSVATRSAWARWLGRLLFLWLVAWAAWAPRLGTGVPRFEPRDWLLHGPALLVLVGAALAFTLAAGRAWRRLAPVGLALAGTLAALVGLAQALLGMARVSISQVTAGLQSVTTACLVALVALALVSASGADEPRAESPDAASTASAVATALFPLVALLLLAVSFVLVMTPMTKPA